MTSERATADHDTSWAAIAFTIATVSYRADVSVAMRSLQRTSPSTRRVAVYFDDRDATMHSNDLYEVMTLDELGLETPLLWMQRTMYNAFELSCALKPSVALALVERYDKPVMYLDSDLWFASDIAEVIDAVSGRDITLAPHRLGAGLAGPAGNPERAFIVGGPVNAGMFIVGPSSTDVLRWWAAQNAFDCIDDVANHMFVDQLPLCVAPVYFDVNITRDPGMNVGFWNTHERPLSESDHRLEVLGRPVRYVHFSGFDANDPMLWSKFADDAIRSHFLANPIAVQLADAYAEQLRTAGQAEARTTPYAWARSLDDVELTQSMRRELRGAIMARAIECPIETFVDPFRSTIAATLEWAHGTSSTHSPLVAPEGTTPRTRRASLNR